MENEIRMTFLSKRCNIAVIRNMLGAMLIENNPTITFINELKTVVSEAVTNCIVHGYNNDETKYTYYWLGQPDWEQGHGGALYMIDASQIVNSTYGSLEYVFGVRPVVTLVSNSNLSYKGINDDGITEWHLSLNP